MYMFIMVTINASYCVWYRRVVQSDWLGVNLVRLDQLYKGIKRCMTGDLMVPGSVISFPKQKTKIS
jgi:hypothetical protein